MMDRLLEICALDGTSGDEGAVRDYIKSSIHADKVITDNLGNLLVFKKGRKTPKNRIMFAAKHAAIMKPKFDAMRYIRHHR